ncbi:DnaD domain-containing protein [Weizmannia acidilactici]|nr:DnaD domain protein [Weizmannia acidilactici]
MTRKISSFKEGEVGNMPVKFGRVVIKEELVALTGDYKLAIVLNQMLYWSERIADFDQFILEEKKRMIRENIDLSCLELQYGWIYKKADELAKECMITNSGATMRRYLDKLCERSWLSKRINPKYRWDKTMQYRVNLTKIQRDLAKLGYVLEGYKLPVFNDDGAEFQNENPGHQDENPNFQNECSDDQVENTYFQNENSNDQYENPCFQYERSNVHDESAIPKTTSEITTETTAKITSSSIEHFPVFEKGEETKNVIAFYEQNGFGTAGSYIAEKIFTWCDELTAELVIEAMKTAVEHGVANWRYCETILKDWAGKNVQTVEEARALQLEFIKRRQGHSGIRRKEVLPSWFSEFEHSFLGSSALQEKSPEDIAALRQRLEKIREQYRKKEAVKS